jgi:hypothetical protein
MSPRTLGPALLVAATLIAPSMSAAQSRWEQCLATKTCKAEVDKAVAAGVAAYAASLPCEAFVYANDWIALETLTGRACVVVERAQVCDGNWCSTWVDRP